ncbi:MAG: hypothetical protein V2A62_02420 [Candidatus Woesearchaeota archaeon]
MVLRQIEASEITPMAFLLEENKIGVHITETIKERTSKLQMYLFSKPCRGILFKLSSSKERAEIINNLMEKLNSIRKITEISEEKTNEFINSEKFKKELFSLPSHYRTTRGYCYNALENQRKILKIIKKIASELNKLRNNLDYKEYQQIFHRLQEYLQEILEKCDKNHQFLSDFQGRVRIEEYLHQSYEQIQAANLLHGGQGINRLKNGDIFVSFKTLNYLQKKDISRWVFKVTRSQVTHVGLFFLDSKRTPYIIDAKLHGVYKMNVLELKEGVIWVVLRPKLSDQQRADLWKVLRRKVSEKIKFSVKKLAGVIPSLLTNNLLNRFTKRRIETDNMFSRLKDQQFCSEFLSEVFDEIGFPLTPKTKGAMVFPSDIFSSPYVDYIGLLFDEDKYTKEKIMKELVQDVKL